MMKKYVEFITESKKDDCVDALKKMLKSKPKVTDRGKSTDKYDDYSGRYPDVKGIYPMSAMKKYLKDKGFTTSNVDAALNVLQNDKEYDLKTIKVKNFFGNETVPHFYSDLSETEAKDIKKGLEQKSKEMNEDMIKKRAEQKKSLDKNQKTRKSPKKK